MRPSLRFLAIAVVGWAGVRAGTLDMLPGAELFRIERSEARAPAIVPTRFPPIEPVALQAADAEPAEYPSAAYPQYAQYAAYAQPPMRPMMVPVYYCRTSVEPCAPALAPDRRADAATARGILSIHARAR